MNDYFNYNYCIINYLLLKNNYIIYFKYNLYLLVS